MYKDFIDNITSEVMDFINEKQIKDSFEIANLIRSIFDDISNKLTKNNEDLILAENIVVEVINKDSGNLYRRYLEIKYLENNNGLILEGEDLSGKDSKIVFMSESAILKIKDLQGMGLNKPRCK